MKGVQAKQLTVSGFAVDGRGVPEVDFDIGESYAGLLPISNQTNSPQLYFWYFPTTNPAGKDELTIWLNVRLLADTCNGRWIANEDFQGGPGCSSLEGLLQENGPFLWNYGTYKPIRNPWTWVNLTNMLWVEQPVGTGFTQGDGKANSTEDAGVEFLGFLRNFIDNFGLQNKKIYITGESYAGMYIPYFADAMFKAKDKQYFDIRGTMMYK